MAKDGFTQATPANAVKLPMIRTIFDFSAEALGELKTWFEQNPPGISVTQILGWSAFQVQNATSVDTSETTVSTAYTDLATVGPSLTKLPDGQYLVIFGFTGSNAGGASIMSVSANSAAVSSDTSPGSTVKNGANDLSVVGWFVTTLKNGGDNSLVAKYRVNAGTGTFFYRRMSAFRFANA